MAKIQKLEYVVDNFYTKMDLSELSDDDFLELCCSLVKFPCLRSYVDVEPEFGRQYMPKLDQTATVEEILV